MLSKKSHIYLDGLYLSQHLQKSLNICKEIWSGRLFKCEKSLLLNEYLRKRRKPRRKEAVKRKRMKLLFQMNICTSSLPNIFSSPHSFPLFFLSFLCTWLLLFFLFPPIPLFLFFLMERGTGVTQERAIPIQRDRSALEESRVLWTRKLEQIGED